MINFEIMNGYFRLLCLLFVLSITKVSSQSKSFIYEMQYKSNPAKDSISKTKFILDVEAGQSIFRSADERAADSTFQVSRKLTMLTTSLVDNKATFKDHKKKEVKKYISGFNQLFAIPVEEPLMWNIENETRAIAGMKAQMATVVYGGRNWTAWFTDTVPLQEGPYIFHGLPGLILEIYDNEREYLLTLTEIKKSEGPLYLKRKTLPISWKQYEKLALDYYADPTREISGKGSNKTFIVKWWDESGQEFTPDFKAMNETEQKQIRENNNPIELNHKINYK